MADPAASLAALLDDAQRVANYASSTGRLTDETLLRAIAKVRAHMKTDAVTDDESIALAMALNNSIKLIEPATLADLGSKWSPVGRHSRPRRYLFAAFAVGLVLVTAAYTQQYSQASAILAGLNDVQAQNATDKAERLFRFLEKNHAQVFSVAGDASDELTFEPYLKNYETLLDIQEKYLLYTKLSSDIDDFAGLKRFAGSVGRLVSAGSWQKAGITDANPTGNPTIAAYIASYKPAASAAAVAPPPATDQAQADGGQTPDSALQHNRIAETRILTELGVGLFAPPAPSEKSATTLELSSDINATQKLVAELGTWILPALYGLLGTVVYQLRSIQAAQTTPANRTGQSSLYFDPPLDRLLIRFALGALAGISTTWLFGPSAAKLFETQALGTSFFGVAFLLGFSIDVFFSILDRLVSFLAESIKKPDTTASTRAS
jgi:hypothetical protein